MIKCFLSLCQMRLYTTFGGDRADEIWSVRESSLFGWTFKLPGYSHLVWCKVMRSSSKGGMNKPAIRHTRCCNKKYTLSHTDIRYQGHMPLYGLHIFTMAIWTQKRDVNIKKKLNVYSIRDGNHVYIFRFFLSSVDTGSTGNTAWDYRSCFQAFKKRKW